MNQDENKEAERTSEMSGKERERKEALTWISVIFLERCLRLF